MSVVNGKSRRALRMAVSLNYRNAEALTRRSEKMRFMTIIRPFAILVVLLSVTPAFAAHAIHPDTHDICREQNVGFCRPPPFDVKIPSEISDGQARANAASKTWPGDMILG